MNLLRLVAAESVERRMRDRLRLLSKFGNRCRFPKCGFPQGAGDQQILAGVFADTNGPTKIVGEQTQAQFIVADCASIEKRPKERVCSVPIVCAWTGTVHYPGDPRGSWGRKAAAGERDIDTVRVRSRGDHRARNDFERLLPAQVVDGICNRRRHAMTVNFPERAQVSQESRPFFDVKTAP